MAVAKARSTLTKPEREKFERHGYLVKGLALHPNVLAIVEELYRRKPLPFETLDFRMGTEQPTHSDTIHFNSMPRGFMCGVWVALEDIDMENGPVVYYPGSHKLQEITLKDIGPDADEAAYSRFIAAMIERLDLKPEYATIRRGQTFIWASNLLPGAARHRVLVAGPLRRACKVPGQPVHKAPERGARVHGLRAPAAYRLIQESQPTQEGGPNGL